ncbi:hypothetical protein D3C75_1323950 [compost metagenome]
MEFAGVCLDCSGYSGDFHPHGYPCKQPHSGREDVPDSLLHSGRDFDGGGGPDLELAAGQ